MSLLRRGVSGGGRFSAVNTTEDQLIHHRGTDSAPSWCYRRSLLESPMDFTRRSFQRSLSSSSQDSVANMYRKGGVLLGVAPTVHGGAGSHGTHISTIRQMVSYSSDLNRGNLLLGNEKVTMKNLNDRLASYLETVRSLGQSNATLEMQIKQWYEANAPSTAQDYGRYHRQIEELQAQVRDGSCVFYSTV